MRRPPHTVVAAWIATGPLGHLYAGVVDWAALLLRWAAVRLRRGPGRSA